ncbi:TPA: glycosyltransferase family 2 protein [Pseudomonas aeruginosa]|uniref:glycosyltransferase family 2 protein n=1 Tax=Pseudomonas TaxID=286 RepID=UPI001A1CD40D|nr:glycosyltransferase family 2 protein [Pseudomonas aeruginosa]MBH3536193.1 glycosyltransferase [Pseudomonas aeruginosa]MBX6553230.1 glycosyltransferase [Pseudomonas aeruginosa]MBX6585252.1 glycosyltransferase [Pseudomonas aeruginosa]MBX6615390.1 glycosyltransferase [Pseudomonas aeruginosa]MBX6878729.1 glycosyltransferase [Pseudomonas aeruginosa]
MPGIRVLITTVPGRTELLRRAIASVCAQTMAPNSVVIVCDCGLMPADIAAAIDLVVEDLHWLENPGPSGAANAWNTGIDYIAQRWPDDYLAILDDDDTWDSEHLLECLSCAVQADWPDLVISGIRTWLDGIEQPREPIRTMCVSDFLAGNPGWQGSNTFIRIATLLRAGGFTPGLSSCNDRDLAIRVLSLDDVRPAFTARHTVNWHHERGRACLSSAGSDGKLNGLARFHQLHGWRMTVELEIRFFTRAQDLFGLSRDLILQRQKELDHAP